MALCGEAVGVFEHPRHVLLGRGRKYTNHPSNKYFQDLIETYVYQYYAESTGSAKRSITTQIIEAVERNFGGFLKWDAHRKEWAGIDQETAHQKVAHALQYRIRCLKRSGSAVLRKVSPQSCYTISSEQLSSEQLSSMLEAANAAYSETCTESDLETVDNLDELYCDEDSSDDLFVSTDFFETSPITA